MLQKIRIALSNKLTQTILMGVIRHVLTGAGGYLVANGYATTSQWQQIAGGIIALGAIVWSLLQKKTANTELVDAKKAC
jgi:F0F1-type ATP synthase assembly protein I